VRIYYDLMKKIKGSIFKILPIFIIPSIILILSVLLKIATGPYWLGANLDPAYLYLVNSLYLIENLTPSFVDHPGTTLEVLGAVVIRAFNLTSDKSDVISEVLGDPEYYLNAIYYVILFLNISSLILVGFYAFKKIKNILFACFAQSASFFFLFLKSYTSGSYILPVASNVFAESLFPIVCNLFIVFLVMLFCQKDKKIYFREAIAFGIVCALGVITKASFAPLLIIVLMLLPGLRSKAGFFFVFLLGCFFLTIPIIPEYKEMLNYIYLFQANIGLHGTGGLGFLSLHSLYQNAVLLLKGHLFIPICLVMGIAFLLVVVFFRKKIDWKNVPSWKIIKFLICILVGIICQIVFVVKHPAPHYLAPAVGFLGIFLAFLYLGLKKCFHIKDRYGWIFLTLLIVGCSAIALNYRSELAKTNTDLHNFSKEVYDKYQECVVCNGYRSSSVAYALYFGDDCKGRHRAFSDQLQKIYPKSLVWNRWDYTFHHFDQKVSIDNLLASDNCVLLFLSKMNFSISYIDAQLIDSVREQEYLYRITSSNREETIKIFLMAKSLEIKKNYKAALVLAQKAKSLGFPQLRIDRYIEELRNKLL